MQVFVTSPDPQLSAQWLDDKRVNKMITESAQIICTVLSGDGVKDLPFKPTHHHHPITKWADYAHQNLFWLSCHHKSLVAEWQHRRGSKHGSSLPSWVFRHIPDSKPPKSFQNSAKNGSRDLDFTWIDDTHLAYQLYLAIRWLTDTNEPTWTKRKRPDWYGHPFGYQNVNRKDNFDRSMLLIERTKKLIGKDKDNKMICPNCGYTLKYESKFKFECKRDLGFGVNCLSWDETVAINQ